MKKRLLCLALLVVMVLSINVVALAGPGGGGAADPIIAALSEMYPTECPEDNQGQDEDCDQDQP